MIITYRYAVKDGAASTKRALRRQARSVNFVWNYCCEIDRKAADNRRAGRTVKRPSGFDLANLCRGVTAELGIHSDTIDATCARFSQARDAIFPKTPRFRSKRRNLDWIPLSNFKRPAKLVDDRLRFLRRDYRLWLSRPIPENGTPKSWNFSADARDRWYVNIQVDLPEGEPKEGPAVGIDLGLKSFAALSNGETIAPPRHYRTAEEKLVLFQRRKQKRRARDLARKITNRRKHFLHVESTKLVRRFAKIIIGDVNSSKLAKTRMAKSVLDRKSVV